MALCTVALLNREACCEAHLLSGTGGVGSQGVGGKQGGLRLDLPPLIPHILAQPPACLSAGPSVFLYQSTVWVQCFGSLQCGGIVMKNSNYI